MIKGLDIDILSYLPSLFEKHCLENKIQDLLFLACFGDSFHALKVKIVSNKIAIFDTQFSQKSKLLYNCLHLENNKIGCQEMINVLSTLNKVYNITETEYYDILNLFK